MKTQKEDLDRVKRKHGFFDITDETEISDSEEIPAPAVSEGESSPAFAKKQVLIIALISVLLIVAFLIIRDYFYSDAIKESTYYPEEWLTPSIKDDRPILDFCEPDWESDILNDEEYLALRGDILYAPNDSVTVAVAKGEYLSMGGKGLLFMANYTEAVINGDHEALNAMFSEEYYKKNKPYSDFTQQRLYNIKIKKYHYKDPKYEDSYISDEYYIISYKIDKNDGLFRDDIGQKSELAQIFKLLIYPDGTIEIDSVVSLPGYLN